MHKNQNYGSKWITQSGGYIKFGFNTVDIQNMGGSHYIMQDDKLFVIYTSKFSPCDCVMHDMKMLRLFRNFMKGDEKGIYFKNKCSSCVICGEQYDGFIVDNHVYCFGSACNNYRNSYLDLDILDYSFSVGDYKYENIMIKKVSDHIEHSCIGYLYDDTNDDLNELVSLYFIQVGMDIKKIYSILLQNMHFRKYDNCSLCHKCAIMVHNNICLDCYKFIKKYFISRYSAIMLLLREICDTWMIYDVGLVLLDKYVHILKVV
jgi:hypothetical protein